MIFAIVPCQLRLNAGTFIKGRSDNSGLPDFVCCDVPITAPPSGSSLDPYIGTDFMFRGNIQMYKVYAIWDGILYEYTLCCTVVGTLEDNGLKFVPISIKKYDNGYKTYLYLKGTDVLFDRLSNPQSGMSISLPVLFDKMMAGQNVNDLFFLDMKDKFVPTIYDHYLAMESPGEINNIMIELGSQCIGYGSSAAAFLYYNYGEDILHLGKIFSYGLPNDVISAYGCSEAPLLTLDRLNHVSDAGSVEYYKMVAIESSVGSNLMVDGSFCYLDKSQPVYYDLCIDEFLDRVYCEQCTDVEGWVTCNQFDAKGYMFHQNKFVDPVEMRQALATLMHYFNSYNSRYKEKPLKMIQVNKTWLDDLYLRMYFLDGTCHTWYLNLALFHLYSPSILRVEMINVLTSSGT